MKLKAYHHISVETDKEQFVLVVYQGQIISAPPLHGWTVGLASKEVISYFQKRNAKILVKPA